MTTSRHTFWIQTDLALYLSCGEIGDLSEMEMTECDRMYADHIEDFGEGAFYVEVDRPEFKQCTLSRKMALCHEVDYYVRKNQ